MAHDKYIREILDISVLQKNLNVSGHISKAREKIKLECHS